MSSQDKQSVQTLEQALDIDIEQIIKECMAADKRKAGRDADRKESCIKNLKQIQRHLKEQKEENEALKKENEDLKITKEDLTHIVKSTIKEEMRRFFMEELKEDLTQEIIKTVGETLIEQQPPVPVLQSNSPSYAELTAFPPLPKIKPTLILSPTDESISTQKIKKQLNAIPSKDLGLLQCTATKAGKIILQCESEEKLKGLKTALTSNDELKESVNIAESKPRRLQIIVFGAPEPPIEPQRITDVSEELQDYLHNMVTPGLERLLNKEPNYNLNRIQRSKRGTVNLILDLPEADAMLAIRKGKTLVGFNHCTVRRFIVVRRCFKCQRFDHTAQNCQNHQTCPFCSEEHSSDDCTRKNNKNKLVCINCVERLTLLPSNDKRRDLEKINHCCFDSGCKSYKLKFEEIKAKIDRAQKTQNSR